MQPARHPVAHPGSTRHPSALPLILTGALVVLVVWLTLDRLGFLRPTPSAEPRVVQPRGDLSEHEQAIIRIYENARDSVVHITTRRRATGGLGFGVQEEGSGSGFLWDEAGTVVTNWHVVKGAEEITVYLGDGEYRARAIQGTEDYDLAVIQLLDPPAGIRPIPLGTSADLQVGQTVLAIGNPFGLTQTLTTGIISALDRTVPTEGAVLRGAIQTDAAINPGNSGGPLLDSSGRLIGVNTAIYSRTEESAGIGFAVPVDLVSEIIPAILAGKSTRPLLGVKLMQPVRVRGVEGVRMGLPVGEVPEGFGSEESGIRPIQVDREAGRVVASGDLLVAVEGQRVAGIHDIRKALSGRLPGERVTVTLLRNWPEAPYIEQVPIELRAESYLRVRD